MAAVGEQNAATTHSEFDEEGGWRSENKLSRPTLDSSPNINLLLGQVFHSAAVKWVIWFWFSPLTVSFCLPRDKAQGDTRCMDTLKGRCEERTWIGLN